MSGKAALAAHYANNRFRLPGLHVELVNRMVSGVTVVDQERIVGLPEGGVVEAIAVHRVADGLITAAWFF